jgi:hypothetical protein
LNPVGLLLDITHSNKEKVMGYKWGDLMLISSQFFVCIASRHYYYSVQWRYVFLYNVFFYERGTFIPYCEMDHFK